MKRIAIDETSRVKGHIYVSLILDLDTRNVIHVVERKGQQTLLDFKGQPLKIADTPMTLKRCVWTCRPVLFLVPRGRARGYRSVKKLTTTIYLIAGVLTLETVAI